MTVNFARVIAGVMAVTYGDLTVEWLGHATVRLEAGERVVYVDPGGHGVLTGRWDRGASGVTHPPARDGWPADGDAVFLTHLHHYAPDGIERVLAEDATIIAFEGIDVHRTDRTSRRPSELPADLRWVGSESEGVVADVPFWTVPAYNRPEGPNAASDGSPIHPPGRGCGFVLSFEGSKVFVPGDTDVLEGHAELDVAVFLAPIGGEHTMDRHAAADLATEMDPDLVVPIHYDTYEGIDADAAAFLEELKSRGIRGVRDDGAD